MDRVKGNLCFLLSQKNNTVLHKKYINIYIYLLHTSQMSGIILGAFYALTNLPSQWLLRLYYEPPFTDAVTDHRFMKPSQGHRDSEW